MAKENNLFGIPVEKEKPAAAPQTEQPKVEQEPPKEPENEVKPPKEEEEEA